MKRKCVTDYWTYKDALKALCSNKKINWNPLSIVFLMPMPKSWSKKKKAQKVGTPHNQDPDLDSKI